MTHKDKHIFDRTPVNKRSARRKGLYLHNPQQTEETSMPPAGFGPAIPGNLKIADSVIGLIYFLNG
jgi:hypothetical protein